MSLSRGSSTKSLLNILRKEKSVEELETEDKGLDIPPVTPPDDYYEFPPEEIQGIPKHYRDTTNQHPLGRLFLRLAATNIELCKKNSIKTNDNFDLAQLCRLFTNGLNVERNNTGGRISRVTSELKDQMVYPERNFNLINCRIKPPEHFSNVEVLTTPEKQLEARKIFPCRSGFRFTGSSSPSIIEFLETMNSSQAIVNLSRPEFAQYLLKCVVGRPYDIIYDHIQFGHGIEDIYTLLLKHYDKRITSEQARKQILSYKAVKGQTLSDIQSQIVALAGRIASDHISKDVKAHTFNNEASLALIRALPPLSSNLVNNAYNKLQVKSGKSPTFLALCNALSLNETSINKDIAEHAMPGKNENSKIFNPYKPKSKFDKNVNTLKEKTNDRVSRNRDRTKRVRALTVSNTKKQWDKPFKQGGSDNRPNSKKGNNTKYCTLCGRSGTHTASELCFLMRDDQGNVKEVIPSYKPCEKCLKVKNKELFHPSQFCISRDNFPKLNMKPS